MPAFLAPLIGLAAGAVGKALQNSSQVRANYTGWQRDNNMYEWQRSDALADWNMQNQYNSPKAQMQRIKEAGLNPNLVYGDGATTPSVPIRTSSQGNTPSKAPELGDMSFVNNSLLQGQDLEIKKAQVDNLKVQNRLMEADAILKGLDAVQKGKTNEKLDMEVTGMKETYMDLLRTRLYGQQLDNTQKDRNIQFTEDENQRKAASNAQSLQQGAEQILLIRAQTAQTLAQKVKINEEIALLKKDNIIRQLDVKLSQAGIRPGTKPWDNIFNQLFEKGSDVHKNAKQLLDKIDSFLPALLKMNAQ